MAYEVTYTHKEEQPIKVVYPSGGCPFIPQSSYTFGSRARIDMCISVNHAVYDAYCALVGAHPSTYPEAAMHSYEVSSDLIEMLLLCMGYQRTSTEKI